MLTRRRCPESLRNRSFVSGGGLAVPPGEAAFGRYKLTCTRRIIILPQAWMVSTVFRSHHAALLTGSFHLERLENVFSGA